MTIQHTVVFTLIHPRESTEEKDFIAAATNQLAAIPVVQDFTTSRQVSPKSDYCFQFSMTFQDEEAYAAYNSHPQHQDFVTARWNSEVAIFQEYDFETY